MAQSANVRSIDAIKRFHAAVAEFQEDARLSISALEMQLLRMLAWLERDRPGFWKREIESCYREMGEWRVRLHQCKMRKMGDFKPTCFEEKKALEKAKRDLEFAQKQIPVVKHWNINAQHEANEYHGRASQLTQIIERDIPALMALLHHAVDRLEAYGSVQVPGATAPQPAAESEGSRATETTSDTQAASPDSTPEETPEAE